jgi:Uncharacterized protein conserved in bacteria
MSRLLLEKPSPGATTCVLVGDALALDRTRLQPFRHLLWLTDRDNVQRARPILPRHAIETTLVDHAPARPAVEQFLHRDPRHLPSVFVSDTVLTQHSAAYRRALDELHTTLAKHHHHRVTRQKAGFVWQKHVLENLADYATHRLPAAWAGALQDSPALIVGPHLTDIPSAHLSHADTTVLFATDSSLSAFARHDLAPDFAVSIEPAATPAKLPESFAPARVILSPASSAAWQTALPSSARYYFSSHHVTVEWLATQGIEPPPLAVAETSTATAIALAEFLGCSPIRVLGEDSPRPTRSRSPKKSAAAPPDKFRQLACLGPAPSLPPPVLLAARNRVRLAATLGRAQAAEIRRTLEHRTPETAALLLRQLFSDQTFARLRRLLAQAQTAPRSPRRTRPRPVAHAPRRARSTRRPRRPVSAPHFPASASATTVPTVS